MRIFKKLCLFISVIVGVLFLFPISSLEVSASEMPVEKSKAETKTDDSWKLILDNVDIDIEYLEPNKYLGLFFDSYVDGNPKDGYLYLCWTSEYLTNTSTTILQFTESGQTYGLFDTKKQQMAGEGNWLESKSKSYPNYNLCLYMTPIGGIKDGQNFGIRLKRNYTFTNVKFGYPQDYRCIGQIQQKIDFDLGMVPTNNGKNSMQLCTHGYEIIKECEAQSYLDVLKFGGYGHFVDFNTTIPIDKIYRVDVSYKVVNDNKPWWEFFLPNDEHQIVKSLTPKRVSGGIFGLYEFQGFKEGHFSSTIDGSIEYKYELHLNYDDDAWNIFEGKEFYEADYRRISEFQILRMNYIVDGETFDVPVKMDVIEGETLFILDPELILNQDSAYYGAKNFIDDLVANLGEQTKKGIQIVGIVLAAILGVFLLALLIKAIVFLFSVFKKPDK